MDRENLKLENQLCFPLYAASRLITRSYQPYLDQFQITYPQYLVLLVLWEKDEQTVNYISKKLILNTNTITPLLQRMESQDLLSRKRSGKDERKVVISLTDKGKQLQEKALCIPTQLSAGLLESNLSLEELTTLREQLYQLIDLFTKKTVKPDRPKH